MWGSAENEGQSPQNCFTFHAVPVPYGFHVSLSSLCSSSFRVMSEKLFASSALMLFPVTGLCRGRDWPTSLSTQLRKLLPYNFPGQLGTNKHFVMVVVVHLLKNRKDTESSVFKDCATLWNCKQKGSNLSRVQRFQADSQRECSSLLP